MKHVERGGGSVFVDWYVTRKWILKKANVMYSNICYVFRLPAKKAKKKSNGDIH